MSRATVFLTVPSALIIALAPLADATGFGTHTCTPIERVAVQAAVIVELRAANAAQARLIARWLIPNRSEGVEW